VKANSWAFTCSPLRSRPAATCRHHRVRQAAAWLSEITAELNCNCPANYHIQLQFNWCSEITAHLDCNCPLPTTIYSARHAPPPPGTRRWPCTPSPRVGCAQAPPAEVRAAASAGGKRHPRLVHARIVRVCASCAWCAWCVFVVPPALRAGPAPNRRAGPPPSPATRPCAVRPTAETPIMQERAIMQACNRASMQSSHRAGQIHRPWCTTALPDQPATLTVRHGLG